MMRRRGGGAHAVPRRRHLASIVTALSVVCGGAAALPAQSRVSVSPVLKLQQKIDALVADTALERGVWGIVVTSLERGDTLYAANSRKLLMPASTMKIVTLAAAAEQLGWDYSYETRLLGVGALEGGTWNGDLVLVGSGDPSIDDWDGAATQLFHAWADRLKTLGISVITGRIIGDDNAFDDDALGAGWAWDDLSASFATGVGALQYNENTAQLVITPGTAAGDPARVGISPSEAPITLRNLLKTGDANAPLSITVRPTPRGAFLELRGTVPLGTARVVRNVSVENPTLYFAATVRAALIAEGIDVRGPAVDVDDLTEPLVETGATPLAVNRSAPLSVLGTTMMKLSQNLYAETLLKTLGAAAANTATVEAGRAVVQKTIASWDIPAADIQMVDGSGLSRYNLVTPGGLVAMLAHAAHDELLRTRFEATLPVAGVDGTLERRMRGTAAQRNVRAKTGSFGNARTMAGYVRTADGEPLAFAILANNYGSPADVVEKTIDAIAISLAQFSRR